MLGRLLKVQMWFCVAGAGDCTLSKSAKRVCFVAASTATSTLQLQLHLQLLLPLQLQPRYTTLHSKTLPDTQVHCPTLPYKCVTLATTKPRTTLVTLHPFHNYERNCNYTTLITVHHNYNSTTLPLQIQLHHTTLHPAVVGEVTDH